MEKADTSQIYKQAPENQGKQLANKEIPHTAKRREASICNWQLSHAILYFPIMFPIETHYLLPLVYSRRLSKGDSLLTKEQKEKKL